MPRYRKLLLPRRKAPGKRKRHSLTGTRKTRLLPLTRPGSRQRLFVQGGKDDAGQEANGSGGLVTIKPVGGKNKDDKNDDKNDDNDEGKTR